MSSLETTSSNIYFVNHTRKKMNFGAHNLTKWALLCDLEEIFHISSYNIFALWKLGKRRV